MSAVVYALFDFIAEESDEITLWKGEPVIVLEKDEGYDDGWWKGRTIRNEVGIFPSNFVSSRAPSALDASKKRRSVKILDYDEVDAWSVDDVCAWLDQIGYTKYAEAFRNHNVDGYSLVSRYLDAGTLKEFGIPSLEKRIRLLNHIHLLKKRQHQQLNDGAAPCEQKQVSGIESLSLSSSVSDLILDRSTPESRPQFFPPSGKRQRNFVDNTTRIRTDIQTLADVLRLPGNNSNEYDYAGYLRKRGGHAHWSWKRRYFLLKDSCLWYFSSESRDAKVLGMICLPSYSVGLSKDCDVIRQRFTFILTHPCARTYFFRAESLCDMAAWMNALTRSCLCIDFDEAPCQKPSIIASEETRRKTPEPDLLNADSRMSVTIDDVKDITDGVIGSTTASGDEESSNESSMVTSSEVSTAVNELTPKSSPRMEIKKAIAEKQETISLPFSYLSGALPSPRFQSRDSEVDAEIESADGEKDPGAILKRIQKLGIRYDR